MNLPCRLSFQELTNLYILVQENLKSLILYIVDSFWEELTKFEHLSSIQSLKVKYDQVKCPLNALYFTRLSRLGKNVFYVKAVLGFQFVHMVL